jgi:selenocysteine-specific translation elongation factor
LCATEWHLVRIKCANCNSTKGIAYLQIEGGDDAARSIPLRRLDGRFRLAIDRSFSLSGIGTVVTGTVFSGEVRAGDKVLLSPVGLAARVRSLHAQNAAAACGRAGQRCALNLVGFSIDKDRIHRGDWVLDEALHLHTDRIDASIRLLPSCRCYQGCSSGEAPSGCGLAHSQA